MAMGAIAAIKGANKTGQVLVVGFDNIQAAQQAILDGRMLATVDQHGDQLAVYGIEYALSRIATADQKLEDKQTAVDLVTKATLSQP
jgi:ribose transport system substrate-binding protein